MTEQMMKSSSLRWLALIVLLVSVYGKQSNYYVLTDQGFVFNPDEIIQNDDRFMTARVLVARGQLDRALLWLNRWYRVHRKTDDRLDAYYMFRANIEERSGKYIDAVKTLEKLLRRHPESKLFHEALRVQKGIADKLANGAKVPFLGIFQRTAYQFAEEIYIQIHERAPLSTLAHQAGLALGEYYFTLSYMAKARVAYEAFLKNFPDSFYTGIAIRRYAIAYLATFKGYEYDVTGLIETRTRLIRYHNKFPQDAERYGYKPLIDRIDQALARHFLVTAQWYEKRDKRVSALYMYQRLIEVLPQSQESQWAKEHLENDYVDLIQTSVL